GVDAVLADLDFVGVVRVCHSFENDYNLQGGPPGFSRGGCRSSSLRSFQGNLRPEHRGVKRCVHGHRSGLSAISITPRLVGTCYDQAHFHLTMTTRTDYLVLGSGIAGLSFALRAAAHGEVTLVTKRSPDDSATSWAQGGIAAVWSDQDSFAK